MWPRAVIDIGAMARKHAQMVPQLLSSHASSGFDTVVYTAGVRKAKVMKLQVWLSNTSNRAKGKHQN